MQCVRCGSVNLVAGYTNNQGKMISVEQLSTGRNCYVWKDLDDEKQLIPNSSDIQCRECDMIFPNPLH